MEIAVGWPVGMALSLFVVLADVLLIVGATRRRPHVVGPMGVLAVAACAVLFCAVIITVWPTACHGCGTKEHFFSSSNWLFWFAGVAIYSIAIQALFAVRYIRYVVRHKEYR